MNETTVKDLLRQAMAGDEPPVGPQIVGGAVRAARSARRRQVAGAIVAVAAIAPGLAFGVPAIAHALAPPAAGQHGYGLTPAAESGSSQAKKGTPPPANNQVTEEGQARVEPVHVPDAEAADRCESRSTPCR